MKTIRSAVSLLLISLAIFFFFLQQQSVKKLAFKKNQFIQLCCFLSKPKYISKEQVCGVFHPMLFTGPNEPIGYINQHHT